MRSSKLLALVAVTATSMASVAFAASGISVRQTTKVAGADKDIWAKVGAFCAIKDWHPAVTGCDESKEGADTFRTLTLKDGAKIKEKLTGKTDTGYTYAIVDGPLPVKDYFASFSVKPDADDAKNAIVVWSSSFAAKGKPDSEARTIIEGVFKDGLAALAEKVKTK